MNKMEVCHKFMDCNAPICPLDEYKSLRIRLPNENGCSLTPKTRRQYKRKLQSPKAAG